MEQYTAPDGSTRYRMTRSEYNKTYNVPKVPNAPVPPREFTQGFQDAQNRQAAAAQAPASEFLRGLGGFPQGQSNLGSTIANTSGNLARDVGIIGATTLATGNPITGMIGGMAIARPAGQSLNKMAQGEDVTAGGVLRGAAEGAAIGAVGAGIGSGVTALGSKYLLPKVGVAGLDAAGVLAPKAMYPAGWGAGMVAAEELAVGAGMEGATAGLEGRMPSAENLAYDTALSIATRGLAYGGKQIVSGSEAAPRIDIGQTRVNAVKEAVAADAALRASVPAGQTQPPAAISAINQDLVDMKNQYLDGASPIDPVPAGFTSESRPFAAERAERASGIVPTQPGDIHNDVPALADNSSRRARVARRVTASLDPLHIEPSPASELYGMSPQDRRVRDQSFEDMQARRAETEAQLLLPAPGEAKIGEVPADIRRTTAGPNGATMLPTESAQSSRAADKVWYMHGGSKRRFESSAAAQSHLDGYLAKAKNPKKGLEVKMLTEPDPGPALAPNGLTTEQSRDQHRARAANSPGMTQERPKAFGPETDSSIPPLPNQPANNWDTSRVIGYTDEGVTIGREENTNKELAAFREEVRSLGVLLPEGQTLEDLGFRNSERNDGTKRTLHWVNKNGRFTADQWVEMARERGLVPQGEKGNGSEELSALMTGDNGGALRRPAEELVAVPGTLNGEQAKPTGETKSVYEIMRDMGLTEPDAPTSKPAPVYGPDTPKPTPMDRAAAIADGLKKSGWTPPKTTSEVAPETTSSLEVVFSEPETAKAPDVAAPAAEQGVVPKPTSRVSVRAQDGPRPDMNRTPEQVPTAEVRATTTRRQKNEAARDALKAEKAGGPTSIRDDIKRLASSTDRTLLADLREQLPQHDRAALDKELIAMQRDGELVLNRNDDPQTITPRDEAAKLMLGDDRRDIVYLTPKKAESAPIEAVDTPAPAPTRREANTAKRESLKSERGKNGEQTNSTLASRASELTGKKPVSAENTVTNTDDILSPQKAKNKREAVGDGGDSTVTTPKGDVTVSGVKRLNEDNVVTVDVTHEGRRVGRFEAAPYPESNPDGLYVMAAYTDKDFQRSGVGMEGMNKLQAEADAQGLPLKWEPTQTDDGKALQDAWESRGQKATPASTKKPGKRGANNRHNEAGGILNPAQIVREHKARAKRIEHHEERLSELEKEFHKGPVENRAQVAKDMQKVVDDWAKDIGQTHEEIDARIAARAAAGKAPRAGMLIDTTPLADLDRIELARMAKQLGLKVRGKNETLRRDILAENARLREKRRPATTPAEVTKKMDEFGKVFTTIQDMKDQKGSLKNTKRHVKDWLIDEGSSARDLITKLGPRGRRVANQRERAAVVDTFGSAKSRQEVDFVFGEFSDKKTSTTGEMLGVKSLTDDAIRSERDLLDQLIIARSSKELAEQFPTMKFTNDMGLGHFNTFIDTVIQDKDLGGRLWLASERFFEVTREVPKQLQAAGLITQEQFDGLVTKQHYSPRRILREDFGAGLLDDVFGVEPQKGLVKLGGGSLKAIETNMAAMLNHIVVTTERSIANNRANVSLFNLVKNNKGALDAMGETFGIRAERKGTFSPDVPHGMVSIVGKVKGKKVQTLVPEWFAKSWDRSDVIERAAMWDFLSYVSGAPIIKEFATGGLNPLFAVRNMLKDTAHLAATQDAYGANYVKARYDIWKDVWKLKGKQGAWQGFNKTHTSNLLMEYLRNGGGGATYSDMATLERGRMNISPRLKQVLEQLSTINNWSENVVRLAHYEKLKSQGVPPLEAAAIARDRINFAQGGTAVRFMSKFMPYLGAGVAGTRSLTNSLTRNPKRALAVRSQIVALSAIKSYGMYMGGTYVIGAGAEAINYTLGEIYDMFSDDAKARGQIVATWLSRENAETGKREFMGIRLPTDDSIQTEQAVGEQIGRAMAGKEVRFGAVRDMVMKALIVPEIGGYAPPAWSALEALTLNKNSFTRQDVWAGGDTGDKTQEYNDDTHPFFRHASKATGGLVGPAVMQRMAASYGNGNNSGWDLLGGVYSTITNIAGGDAALKQSMTNDIIDSFASGVLGGTVIWTSHDAVDSRVSKEGNQKKNLERVVTNRAIDEAVKNIETIEDVSKAVPAIRELALSVPATDRKALLLRATAALKTGVLPKRVVSNVADLAKMPDPQRQAAKYFSEFLRENKQGKLDISMAVGLSGVADTDEFVEALAYFTKTYSAEWNRAHAGESVAGFDREKALDGLDAFRDSQTVK